MTWRLRFPAGNLSLDQQPAIDNFYSAGHATVPILVAVEGNVFNSSIELVHQARHIGRSPGFLDRLREIAMTTRIIAAGKYRFEVAEVNRQQQATTTVHVSTYRSSISRNPGNVAELAFEADGRRVIYVSSLGRGGTSGLSRAERRRFSTTGSLIADEHGVIDPLPVAHALADALANEVPVVSSLRSDSSGRVLTSALAVCLPRDSLSSLYQNASPHISPRGRLATAVRLQCEDIWEGARLLQISPDPDRISRALAQRVTKEVPELFARSVDATWIQATSMSWANFKGLAMPTSQVIIGAAFADLRQALSRHPSANCGLTFGSADPLFAGVQASGLNAAIADLSIATGGQIRSAVLEGVRHNAHSIYPHFYRELEATLIA